MYDEAENIAIVIKSNLEVDNPMHGISLKGFKEVLTILVETIHYPEVDTFCKDMLHDQLGRIDLIAASLFQSLDSDENGKITKDEFCDHFYSAMHEFSEPNSIMQKQMKQRIKKSIDIFMPKFMEESKQRLECQCALM